MALSCGFASLHNMAAVSACFDELRRHHDLGLDLPLDFFVPTSIAFGVRIDFKTLGDSLAFRELEAPAGFLLAVFLALDNARVAGQKSFFLKDGAQIRLVID
jgi:hypothetical protein